MPTITDRKLATLYASFEAQKRTNPNLKLGAEQALQILAEIGDRSGWSAAKTLTELKKPGVSRDQQVEIAKKGLSAAEKKDLASILDAGTVPLEPSAKDFLGAVLGRTTPPPGPTPGGEVGVPNFKISTDQANGISGLTKAGATIEAINLTTAPSGRYHTDDTFVIGKADATGKFTGAKLQGDMAMKEGDVIRMRARYADGTTSDWVNIKANTAETADTRNAQVAVFRIGLTAGANGTIGVENINGSRQISEPGAKVQFTNARTGEKQVVTLNGEGTFPAGVQLKGKAGDTFAVAASDGINNTDFRTSVGNVSVPGGTTGGDVLPDPALHKDEMNADGTPKFGKKLFTGPLFADGVKAGDAQQGQIGNCYFPAAVASIAQMNPDLIQNMVKANGDGTYTVTFKERDWATGRTKDVAVKVDGELYARSYGGPLYGHSSNSSEPTKMEMWYPIIEKAYAQWKGSYDAIGNGGSSADVFEDFTGAQGRSTNAAGNPDSVWRTITTALDAKKPVAAGTHDDGGPVNYANTGVFGDHAYSILGYEKVGADRILIIRNPWGESEPAGNGANDGVFKMKLEEFQKLYDNVMTTN
ncbi:MAG: C2 family cysteine protease [Archangium sp.]|nr:C2 family cysteine protease [Archangium sp.]MDP3571185.1 C2 family cysteine protease [Archangium sp.]